MIERSAAYQAAITATSRRMLLKAVIDIVSPDIVYGETESNSLSPYSNTSLLRDKDFTQFQRRSTLEQNRWLLGGDFGLFAVDKTADIPYMSEALSGTDGVFAEPVTVTQPFGGVSILQACSVYFSGDAAADGIPEDFRIEILQGGTVYHTEEFTGNSAAIISMSGFTVYDPDAIRVVVTKMSLPLCRVRAVEILPGVYEEWNSDIIAAFDVAQQGDISCLSLPYGTCTLRMDNLDRRFEPRNKNGLFRSIEERQGIPVSIGLRLEDGSTEYKQIGVYYQYAGGWRTGDNGLTMQWDLVDIIGLVSGRAFIPPDTLPNTLSGWFAAVALQLGNSFADMWHVDPDYADLPLTCSREKIAECTCGDVLRWACMATGTWPRADAETGCLTAEPLWDQGNELTLDNMETYPVMKANEDLAALIFTLNDGSNTQLVVSGNATASSKTVSVSNPFIQDKAAALKAARAILAAYGGNRLEVVGRGDPSSELGDVDTVWLNESSATTGRRIAQTFGMQGGVLRSCSSTLLQADGSFLFQDRAVITSSGIWTAPSGVTSLRLILVGKGEDGTAGTDGTWDTDGENGADGAGALIWAGTVSINDGQIFDVSISDTGTTFGSYSSANGQRYPLGYTDISGGDSFGRSGVKKPLVGSGDGGAGGVGGVKGNRRTVTKKETYTDPETGKTTTINWPVEVIDNRPGSGTPGTAGVTGCVVVYWDKA